MCDTGRCQSHQYMADFNSSLTDFIVGKSPRLQRYCSSGGHFITIFFFKIRVYEKDMGACGVFAWYMGSYSACAWYIGSYSACACYMDACGTIYSSQRLLLFSDIDMLFTR